jgi:nicotinate-nucleotide--dimethylbenzimidazole phosphoribosyltransferase
VLAQIGGPDLAVATGALLGATARRMPVLLDGPVGVAAALIARDLGGQSRHWCLLPDAGVHALVKQGADVLGLTPVLQLGLDLGEGTNALATLPLFRSAIGLAAALPAHPALREAAGEDSLSHGGTSDAVSNGGGPSDGGTSDGGTSDEIAETVELEQTNDVFVPNDDVEDFAEPEPNGPGPASTSQPSA